MNFWFPIVGLVTLKQPLIDFGNDSTIPKKVTKGRTWEKQSKYQVIQFVPFSSPIVGGHLTPWKGHVNSPSQKGHELNHQKFGIMGIIKLSSRKIQNDLDLFWRNGDFLTDLYKKVRRHQFWPFICESFFVWLTFSKHRDVWWNNHHFILCHDLVFVIPLKPPTNTEWLFSTRYHAIQKEIQGETVQSDSRSFRLKKCLPFWNPRPPRKLTIVTGWKIHHVHESTYCSLLLKNGGIFRWKNGKFFRGCNYYPVSLC